MRSLKKGQIYILKTKSYICNENVFFHFYYFTSQKEHYLSFFMIYAL